MGASADDLILRTILNDLDMSFGRVGVIHESQFLNSAIAAGMTSESAEELSALIGLKEAVNHELPAVAIIETIRSKILERNIIEENSEKEDEKIGTDLFFDEKSTEKLSTVCEVAEINIEKLAPKFDSYVDMNMMKVSPNGYAGNFIDRHLVYTIEDQNKIIKGEFGNKTCQVTRRFSDFVAVREYLLVKYPFRCVPRLPAKRVQMFSDEAFLLYRQKSLRRFLGIISRHHLYKTDPLIQAFIYNQKEFQNLISDPKFIARDKDHMLLTQISSADALIQANMKENLKAIEKGRSDSNALVSFCVQIRDQIKGLIETVNGESNFLTKLSSTLFRNNSDIKSCLCSETCQNCLHDQESQTNLSSKLTSINETTEANTIIEFEEIVEKFNLLIDLFESFNDLINRGNTSKYTDFDEIRKEIGLIEGEIEKRRAASDEEGSIERLQNRIDSLKQEWDEQDTFNKFIQFSMNEEMKWVHCHKIMIRHLLDQFVLTITLKHRQWIAIFDS